MANLQKQVLLQPAVVKGTSLSTNGHTIVWNYDSSLTHTIDSNVIVLGGSSLPAQTHIAFTSSEKQKEGLAPAPSLYPHFYDAAAPTEASGAPVAMEQLNIAIADIDHALDAYQSADMAGLWSSLELIAGSLKKAHSFTKFNEALGAVISYAFQAIESVDFASLGKDSLMALQACLRGLRDTPTMSLADAGEAVDKLEEHGWRGSDEDVARFVNDLLAYFDLAPPVVREPKPEGLLDQEVLT